MFDGNVTGGKALNAKTATGKAAMGSLGPGAIYVDGTVKNSKGETIRRGLMRSQLLAVYR